MNFLQNLHKSFRVVSTLPASTQAEIKELRTHFGTVLPMDFETLIGEAAEIEILVLEEEFIRIWGAAGCLEMNEAYEITDNIPNCIGIGDDERGNALIWYPSGEGLYLAGFGCLDIDEAKFVSPNLKSLLHDAVGAEVLL